MDITMETETMSMIELKATEKILNKGLKEMFQSYKSLNNKGSFYPIYCLLDQWINIVNEIDKRS